MESVHSLPRNTSVPMRQPSAEDLDAAQQLVSSAQAGREHLADHYGDSIKSSGSPPLHHGPGSASGLSDGRSEQERTSPRGQKDTSFLGHSCRYVFWSFTFLFVDTDIPAQQLWNKKYPPLATVSNGGHDLQCLWSLPESPQCCSPYKTKPRSTDPRWS